MLVVDDQPTNIKLLDAILTPRGYDVRGAGSGEEALAALAEGGRGPGPARHRDARYGRLRGVPADPRRTATAFLPVVMVTASGDEQKIKALEAGADDFLTKPIDRNELLARVASLARIKRYQDTSRGRQTSWPLEPGAGGRGWRPRSASSSGWASSAGSCPRSSPS